MDELSTKIENLIQAVSTMASKVDEIEQRLNEVKSVTDEFTQLKDQTNDMYAQQEYDNALSDWRCKFGEKLDKFDALAKAEEGDDFDLVKRAFDDYNEHDYAFSPDEYVDKRVAQFEEKAQALAKAAGSVVKIQTETPDGEVEVTATPDGDVKTEVEGEAIESKEKEVEKSDDDKEKKSWKDVAKETDFSSWNV